MGNFLVSRIYSNGSNKCGGVLLDVLRSTPRYESTSTPLFNYSSSNSGLLSFSDNLYSHPFISNSSYNYTLDYDPFTDITSIPSLESLKTEIAELSASSSSDGIFSSIGSFVDDYIWQPIKQTVPWIGQKVEQGVETLGAAATSVGNFVSGIFNSLVNFAKSFIGKINNDRDGNRAFSGGKNRAWCADFVTYCTKKVFGSKLPSDFGSAAVSGLRDWGQRHNCYLAAPFNQGLAAMRNFLKTKVKVGDIMIEKRNGKSHTGIVTYVDPEGKFFKTVEGNTSNKVAERKYMADSKTLSGFVSLAQFA